MNFAELEQGITNYLDNEIFGGPLARAPMWKRAVFMFAIFHAKATNSLENLVAQYAGNPIFNALNIITPNGQIGDINTILDSLKKTLEFTGEIMVPVIDIAFRPEDIDVLRGYLLQAQGQAQPQAQPMNQAPQSPLPYQ